MKATLVCQLVIFFVTSLLPETVHGLEPRNVIELWPGKAPGEKGNLSEESNLTKPADRQVAGKPVIRISNVSKPTISIYPPPAKNNKGAAVLVCPGGAYNILASDLEGSEVCEWLNSLGVTAVLLKYRVPRREGLEKHVAPLQDAQRAMGLIRQRASELQIDPARIGVIGFSAGGHLAAVLSTTVETRTYAKVDSADSMNCRPNFALLIYPAYFTASNDLTRLSPEVEVTTNHPPTFLAMTQDDSQHVENVLLYSLALKQNKIPVELHVYPGGGHGYGLRQTGNPSATWPDRASEWLRNQGLLSKK